MKTLIIAATFASAILSFTGAVQAATTGLALSADQLQTTSIDRRGRGCDSARDRAEKKPRCTKV